MAGARKTRLAAPTDKKAALRRKLKKAFWWACIIVGLPVVVGVLVFLPHLNKASKLIGNLPTVIEQVNSQASTILSDDGETLYSVQGQYRRPVSIENVPQVVINATIAAEDKRFWEHEGIDFSAMRNLAVLALLSGGDVPRGGSTLSMQLAKRVYTSPEKTLSRKLDDMALAVMIERSLSKYQILELYLNQVYYGKQAYGIGAAADVYFGKKNLYDLTLGEAAMLARLVRRPSDENPFVDLETAKKNRDIVLSLMLEERMITKDEYDKALKEKPKLAKERPQTVSGRKKAPYFVDAVLREVKEDFDVDLKLGGYTIETTLNWQLQDYAEQQIAKAIKDLRGQKVTTAAMFLTDRDGAVIVHVGGGDYDRNQFDVVTQGARQPGSSFKPFVYSTAFERGLITPFTQISNEVLYWDGGNGQPQMVHNSNEAYGGSMSVESAIMGSVNVPAARVMMMTGPGNVVALAKNAFGFKSDLAAVPALALGATAVSPLEMARAYSVFKNDGDRVEPYFIRRIVGPDGQVMKRYGSRIVRSALSKTTANTMDTILYKNVNNHGTGWRVASQEGVVNGRGKTGTTNNYRDAWFCGYTNRFLGIAWVGSEVRKGNGWVYQSMNRVFGGTAVAPFWGKIVHKAQTLLGEERLAFQPSYSSNGVDVDADPNKNMFEELPPLDPNKLPPLDERATGRAGSSGATAGPPVRTGGDEDRVLDIVYVEVCADSGARATVYCPERVKKPFLVGAEPKGTCPIHRPPQ